MPVSYTGIIEEHMAVRETVGLFDVSHMGEFHVSGPESEAFLDYLLTNTVAGTPVGKAVYSPMCQEDGGVVDDLIIYRTAEDAFLVCVNASNADKDFAWFQKEITAFDCSVENKSSAYGLLALQGPNAEALLNGLTDIDLTLIKRFWHAEASVVGKAVRISRTGYTGEDGFEIYCAGEDATSIAEALVEAGGEHGLKLAGLGARDSLRLEAGYPLYGHEISDTINPLQGGVGWTVKLKKDNFIGHAALKAAKEMGVHKRISHFTLDGRRIAREGTDIISNGKPVGKVVSGTMSPVLKQPIGAALIDFSQVDDPDDLSVDLRGNITPLNSKKPPLHQ